VDLEHVRETPVTIVAIFMRQTEIAQLEMVAISAILRQRPLWKALIVILDVLLAGLDGQKPS